MLVGLPETYADYLKCPMIDARRMEVYCLLGYDPTSVIKETHALIVEENTFEEQLGKEKVLFFGNGSDKCKEILDHPNTTFLDNITPEAKNIGQLAYKKHLVNDFVDLAYFEPEYLKPYLAIKAKNPLQ
jgi:tRNA threonylcarbamoyladenosine biosynthesis protein TsaB